MGAPQTITSPGGDEMVVLPREEYEALVDAADARAAAHARVRIDTGLDETVPSTVVDRLLDGDNPVRVWREHRSISVTELASAAGISHGYLSQIEGGTRQGRLETMKSLAKALRVDLDDITG